MSKGGKKDKAQAKIGSSSGFVSFSSLSSASGSSSSSVLSSAEETSAGLTPVYTGSDSDLIVISKKLLKKDGVTKVRALTDLCDVLRATNPEVAKDEIMPQLLPFFAYIYLRLVSDDDRKVREKLNAVLHQVISIDKRALGPYMAVLIGPWWVSMSDASPEVASAAQSSFELAIPKIKRTAVVAYLAPNLLKYIQTNLSYTVETIVDMKDSNSKDNKADLEERFERVVTGTLDALTSLLLVLDESEHAPLVSTGYTVIFVENFWKKALSKRDAVRRSAYTLLTAATKRIPAVFERHSISRISAFIVNFLAEGAAGNLNAMFDLVLVLLSHHKQCAIYYDAKLNAEFMEKLKALVHSFPAVAIQYLVPLFGCFPPSSVSIRACGGGGESLQVASSYDEVMSVVDYLLELSERHTFPEPLLPAVDCCVCEVSLLVLLRQPDGAEGTSSAPSSAAALQSARAVVDRFVNSFVLLLKASPKADKTPTKLLLTFQRAQAKQINFSSAQWDELFWDTLTSALQGFLGEDARGCVGQLTGEGKAPDLVSRHHQYVSTLADTIFECCQACLQTEVSTDGLGLFALLRRLVSDLAADLDAAAGAGDVETVLLCAIKARALATLVERGVEVLGRMGVSAHDCLRAAVSGWVEGYSRLMSRQGAPTDASLTPLLSTQFYQFLLPLKRALLAKPLVDEASWYSSKLLSYFVASDCVGGVITLIDSRLLGRKSVIDSDSSVAYLKKTFGDCMGGGANPDRTQLALQYSARAVLCLPDAISSDLLALLDGSLEQSPRSKNSVFVYLSTVASRSDRALARFDSLGGADLLVKLFFNRLRDVRDKSVSASHNESSGIKVVSDWDSARRFVLPVLSAEQQSSLCELIAGELRGSIDSFAEAPPGAMQASKLARHVAAIAALPHDVRRGDNNPVPVFGTYDSPAILSLVQLGSPSFWASKRDGALAASKCGAEIEFILDVTLTADGLWSENASVAKSDCNSFLGTGLCANAGLFVNILAFIEACRALPRDEQADGIVREKLALLSATVYKHVRESSDSAKLSLLQSLLSLRTLDLGVSAIVAAAVREVYGGDVYSYKVDADSLGDKRLVLDTPLPLDSLLKGSSVMYARKGCGGAGFELVEARVARSHVEPPYASFHTLQVGGAEVQTGSDRIVLFAAPLSHGAAAASSGGDLDPVTALVYSWLEGQLAGFSEAAAGRDDGLPLDSVAVVDVAVELLSTSNCERAQGIIGQYRDAAARLLEADPLGRGAAFALGVDLFLRLLRGLSSPSTAAEIVWLMSALKSADATAADLASRGPLGGSPDDAQVRAVSSLCRFYGTLTMAVKWRACAKSAFAFLALPLGACTGGQSSGYDGKLVEHVISCAHSCFCDRWKALHSSAPPHKGSLGQAVDGAATAALERSVAGKDGEREDEIEKSSFRLCLRVVLDERRRDSELQRRCADAILCFLVARDAPLLGHFLRQVVSKDAEQALLDFAVDTNVHSQVRLCSSRILHALYFSCRGSAPAAPEEAGGGESDEDAECRLNESLFCEVVGAPLASELSVRFKSTTMKTFTSARGDVLRAKQKDWVGCILLWLLCLQKIDANSANGHERRARCGQHLSQSKVLESALFLMLQIVPDLLKFKKLSTVFDEMRFLADREQLQSLTAYAMFRTICTFPAMTRCWWSDCCDRNQKQRVSKFIEERVRTSLISREVGLVESGLLNKRWDNNEFQVKGSVVSGEITGSLLLEDTKVEVKITLPPSYPLKNVEVVSSKFGIAEDRVRRWVLQIIQMLSLQDGAVIDALLMWKKNVEKELEGVEACPICYSILHPKSMGLPNLCCSTCSNKFHSACLHTWFKSSGKTKCVICQQVWNS